MSIFEIKKGINHALGSSGKKIVEIDFLGVGGAFDIEEGDSSVLIKTKSGKFLLIDCGYTSYYKLKKMDLISDVDIVFITHTHSDHQSGLSTLIYDRFFLHNKTTVIECHELVAPRVKQYLDICGHPENQYIINTKNFYIEEDCLSVTKIDTSAHHWSVNNFPNSGLLFHFDTGDDYFVLIYSGDINTSILNLMPKELYPFVYEKPDNVFIFHDMTSLEYEQNPHTNWRQLVPVRENFKNLFTYHHNENHVSEINKQNPNLAYTSLIIQGRQFVIEEVKGI